MLRYTTGPKRAKNLALNSDVCVEKTSPTIGEVENINDPCDSIALRAQKAMACRCGCEYHVCARLDSFGEWRVRGDGEKSWIGRGVLHAQKLSFFLAGVAPA